MSDSSPEEGEVIDFSSDEGPNPPVPPQLPPHPQNQFFEIISEKGESLITKDGHQYCFDKPAKLLR